MHKVLEVSTKLMAKLLARAASRIFLSTASWERMLRPMLPYRIPIEALPVPSNVEVINDNEAIRATRAKYTQTGAFLVGHFSAHPQTILTTAIPALLADKRIEVMLIGRGSCDFKQSLAARCNDALPRLHTTGELSSRDLSVYLSACDLMLQPYPDGITTRRTSAMAAIAHRRPVLTTKGELTEPIWSESAAVSMVPVYEVGKLAPTASRLLDDPNERQRLSLAGAKLYEDSFDLRHTVNILRAEN